MLRAEEQLTAWGADAAEGGEEGEREDRPRPALAFDWFLPPFTKALQLADAALEGHA